MLARFATAKSGVKFYVTNATGNRLASYMDSFMVCGDRYGLEGDDARRRVDCDTTLGG